MATAYKIIIVLIFLLVFTDAIPAEEHINPDNCEIIIDDFSNGLGPGWMEKSFAGKSYDEAATLDPDVVKSWFAIRGRFRGDNIGIACGRNLCVLDVDNNNGKRGSEARIAAEKINAACCEKTSG